jgi:hypothetical protein
MMAHEAKPRQFLKCLPHRRSRHLEFVGDGTFAKMTSCRGLSGLNHFEDAKRYLGGEGRADGHLSAPVEVECVVASQRKIID